MVLVYNLLFGNVELRLAIHLVLCGEWEQLASFLATVCGSWVPVNRGSTGRSIVTPLGNENYVNVRKSNKMVSRTLVSDRHVLVPQFWHGHSKIII